jgi:hypothetical protein
MACEQKNKSTKARDRDRTTHGRHQTPARSMFGTPRQRLGLLESARRMLQPNVPPRRGRLTVEAVDLSVDRMWRDETTYRGDPPGNAISNSPVFAELPDRYVTSTATDTHEHMCDPPRQSTMLSIRQEIDGFPGGLGVSVLPARISYDPYCSVTPPHSISVAQADSASSNVLNERQSPLTPPFTLAPPGQSKRYVLFTGAANVHAGRCVSGVSFESHGPVLLLKSPSAW